MILPDTDAPVLTRELIYTAVTRARKSVTVWGEEELFIRAVSRRSTRSSGLRDALQSNDRHVSNRDPIHLDN
ncbi:MAG: hypothetical protein KJ649_00460 [Proteobacteria bacterium]|nr:hypothetical protein [Pseudomonadota bacterium]MBU1743360.1 hypothetical protein [Pseudomonadota bacterium]MBU1966593.1 hypothetical protein [Pseudomonadota bacterium]